jgi:hypothetical protein
MKLFPTPKYIVQASQKIYLLDRARRINFLASRELRKVMSLITLVTFFFTSLGFPQTLPLSNPVLLQFPALLRYLSVNQSNPFNYFNFLLDKGDSLAVKDTLNSEAKKLINYFFLGITLPSNSFWVNLNPDEPDRITSSELARTDLGRILLEEDLQLKKDAARYLHPHNPKGREFWQALYSAIGKDKLKKAKINTSNRVWIVPDEATVLETEDGALVLSAKLKVLLESEYFQAKSQEQGIEGRRGGLNLPYGSNNQLQLLSESLMKQIILPALTQDINTSPTYAPLRQAYHSLILAEWFKRKHKTSSSVYSLSINKGYTKGLESSVPWEKQQIWQDYLSSYNKGEYNIQDTILGLKRMYWSGGMELSGIAEVLNIVSSSAIQNQENPLLNHRDNLFPVLTSSSGILNEGAFPNTESETVFYRDNKAEGSTAAAENLSVDSISEVSNKSAGSPLEAASKKSADAALKKEEISIQQSQEESRQREKLEPAAQNAIQAETRKIQADFGFLATEHPLTQYINRLISSLFKDSQSYYVPDFKILSSLGAGVNSWVYANGTIILTPELLNFAESVEEVVFVILHEVMHYDRRHFKRAKDIEKRDSIRQSLGLARYQEYNADIAAYLMMSEKGYNNLGAITFMNRLRAQGKDWGPVHGSSTDRSLNMQSITYFADLTGLSHTLTPLPAEVKDHLRQIDFGNRIDKVTRRSYDAQSYNLRHSLLENADWYLLQYCIPEIYKRISGLQEEILKQHEGSLKSAWKNEFTAEQRLLDTAFKRFDELFSQAYAKLDKKNTVILRFLITAVAFGVPFNNRLDKPGSIMRKFADEFKSLEYFRQIRDILEDELIFSKADLFFQNNSLEKALVYMINLAKEKGLFEDEDGAFDLQFYLKEAHQLIKAGMALAERRAVGNFDSNRVWTKAAFSALEEFFILGMADGEETVEEFLQELKNNTYPPIQEDYLLILVNNSKEIDEQSKGMIKAALSKDKAVPAGLLDERANALNNALLNYLSIRADKDKEVKKGERLGAITKDYSLEEIVKQMDSIRSSIWDTYSFLNLAEDVADSLSKKYISSSNNMEGVFEVIHFIQLFIDDYSTCERLIKDILGTIISVREDLETFLSLEQLNKFSAVVNSPKEAEKRFGLPAALTDISLNMNNFSDFRILLLIALNNKLSGINTGTEFFEEIDNSLQIWKLPSLQDAGSDFYTMREMFSIYNSIAKKGAGFLDLTAQNKGSLKWIYALSFFIQDIFIKNYVQDYVLSQLVKELPFEDAVQLTFQRYKPNAKIGISQAIEFLIEERVQLPGQFEAIKQELTSMYNIDEPATLTAFGNIIGMDAFSERLFKNHSGLLAYLLETSTNDSAFRRYLFDIWYGIFREGMDIREAFDKELGDDIKDWQQSLVDFFDPVGAFDAPYLSLDGIVDSFYRMNYLSKNVLLRKLLMGNKGVLTKPFGRKEFLNELLARILRDGGDAKAKEVIYQVFEAITETASDDQLYFALFPLLINRIANAPQQSAPWGDIIDDKRIVEDVLEQSLEYLDEKDRAKVKQHKNEYAKAMQERILTWIRGYSAEKEKTSIADESLFQIVPPENYRRHSEMLSEIEFIVEIAKNLGSPGVRSLQLLGQFIRIPQDYKSYFSEVYDSVKGQSRLSAYETLKREMPGYLAKIKKFGKRRGGGSLVTVYEVELKDGTKEVIKILNPNAGYHKTNTIALLKETMKALEKKEPQYKHIAPLLADLDQWLDADIQDTAYFEDDQEFRNLHNGYKPQGFHYKIKVPQSFYTGSIFVKREEFIEGHNFTDLSSLSQEKRREIVSLVVRNYFEQVRGILTNEFSLVHSDVHQGNLRVTPNKEVVILDRNFYLKLSLADRFLLYELIKPGEVKDKIRLFVEYLLNQKENYFLRAKFETEERFNTFREDIISVIVSSISKENLEDIVLDALVQLRSEGINAPLRVSLLIKNLNSLNQMSKEAGFSSLIEAKEYSPDSASSSSISQAGGDKGGIDLSNIGHENGTVSNLTDTSASSLADGQKEGIPDSLAEEAGKSIIREQKTPVIEEVIDINEIRNYFQAKDAESSLPSYLEYRKIIPSNSVFLYKYFDEKGKENYFHVIWYQGKGIDYGKPISEPELISVVNESPDIAREASRYFVEALIRANQLYPWAYHLAGFIIAGNRGWGMSITSAPYGLNVSEYEMLRLVRAIQSSRQETQGIKTHLCASVVHELIHSQRGETLSFDHTGREVVSQMGQFIIAKERYNQHIKKVLESIGRFRRTGDRIQLDNPVYDPDMYTALILIAARLTKKLPQLSDAFMGDMDSNKSTALGKLGDIWANVGAEELTKLTRELLGEFMEYERDKLLSLASQEEVNLGITQPIINGLYDIATQPKVPAESSSDSALNKVPGSVADTRKDGIDGSTLLNIDSSAGQSKGGIDLSNIELTLKDGAYVSNLSPADVKVLRAAKALREGWESLSLLYVHEIMLLFEDNIAKDLANKDLLSQVLEQLKIKDFLNPQAANFLNLIQARNPIEEIMLTLSQ